MKTTFSVTIPGDPIPWKRTRGRGFHRFSDPRYKAFKERCIVYMVQAMKAHRSNTGAIIYPCILRAGFYRQAPKRKPSGCHGLFWHRDNDYPLPIVPDLDNLVKGIKDALTDANVIDDDNIIVGIRASKWGSRKPRSEVALHPVTVAGWRAQMSTVS